jgi:uncharacterized protein YggE
MKSFRPILLLFAFLVVSHSQVCCDANTIQITGTANVFAKADTAKLNVGVTSEQKTTS